MRMPLPNGRLAVTLGLALVTVVSLALTLTVPEQDAWFAVLAAAVALALSPLLAGWLSLYLRYAALFPVSVLAGLTIAAAIYEPFTYHENPVFLVISLTIFCGGPAYAAFLIGWLARQYFRRRRGHKTS